MATLFCAPAPLPLDTAPTAREEVSERMLGAIVAWSCAQRSATSGPITNLVIRAQHLGGGPFARAHGTLDEAVHLRRPFGPGPVDATDRCSQRALP